MTLYWVTLPFRHSRGVALVDVGTGVSVSIAGHPGSLTRHGRKLGDYLIRLDGFPSKDAAAEALAQLRRALFWTSLRFRCGLQATATLQGAPIDSYDPAGNPPAVDEGGVEIAGIGPKDRGTIQLKVGEPTRKDPVQMAAFINEINLGMALPATKVDRRVGIAEQFATDSYFQTHPYSRFIMLISALEVLKESGPLNAGEDVLTAIDALKGTVQEAGKAEPWRTANLQSLLTRIDLLKERSIGEAIRAAIARHLGDEDARSASALYRYRSDLLHNGSAPEIMRHVFQLEALVLRFMARVIGGPV